MIDTATGNERNLKNIRQIGTPSEEDRIYIENAAYQRVHADEYAPRRAFVFMGHTECEEGRYTTFIEAAIPVRDIEFSQNIPKWDNRAWADIFREVKRAYEEYIIVGWALDIKGFTPRMSRELEEVHREQFGGAHQMLLLMDSLEGEEYFYVNRGSRLQKWDGFYIYYCPRPKNAQPDITLEIPQARLRRQGRFRQAEYGQQERYRQAEYGQQEQGRQAEYGQQERYRQAGYEQNGDAYAGQRELTREERERLYAPLSKEPQRHGGRRASSYAMAAAIVLLVAMVGAGIYQERIPLPGIRDAINTMSSGLLDRNSDDSNDAEVLVGTEPVGDSIQGDADTEDSTETISLIPVQNLPSGEIRRSDDTQKQEEETQNGKKKEDSGTDEPSEENKDSEKSGQDKKDEGKNDSEKKDRARKENNKKDTAETAAEAAEFYIVKRGDTLTAICNQIYGSPDRINQLVELNQLEDANDIRVGQKLLLP